MTPPRRWLRFPRAGHRVVAGALLVMLLASLGAAQDEPPADAPERGTGGIVLTLSVSPLSGNVSTEFRLEARGIGLAPPAGTLQPDGTRAAIVRYEWDPEGDGTYVEGTRRLRHTYDEDGVYTAAVRVTDSTGAEAVAHRNITVGEPRTGLRWDVVWTNLPAFWKGAQITLYVSVIAIVAGLPLGVVFGLLRISPAAPVRWLAGIYIEFLRGTPLLVQIFFVVFALPQIGVTFSALTGGIIALTVNTSAYQAEIVRSGIQAIPSGQNEAALALGFTYAQTMREVILPQALRLVIPPLTNEFIILIKDSSLVSVIGVLELMGFARVISNRTFRFFEPLIAVAVMYFVLTYSLSLFLQWVERRLAIPGLGMPGTKGAH